MGLRRALARLPGWVRVGAALLVVGLSFYYLGNNIARGLRQIDSRELSLQPAGLFLSLLLFMVSNFIGGWCWSLMLDSLGQKQPLRASVKVHLSANIVKYLPGFAWQILGKVYLCGKQGISGWLSGIGIALELALIVLTGIWVAALTVPTALLDSWGIGGLSAARWPGVIALTVLLLSLPWLQRGMGRYGRGRLRELHLSPRPLVLILALFVLAWFVLGLAVYSLINALYPVDLAVLPGFISCWAAASVVSLAVVFVPTGIGVKEGALAFLLAFYLPAAVASVVAILTRVVVIVSEVLCFLIAQKL